jgi:phosphopantetheinyl transferase (holo-ACP synthase)
VIGNDIVDLAVAKKESNWQRKGFLNKIFTFEEQLRIQSSENQEIAIWSLWSRKEAAYKIYNRSSQLRLFNPFQLECWDETIAADCIYGKVILENQLYYTKTEINSDFIYTEAVVNEDDFDKIIHIPKPTNIEKTNGIPSYFDLNTNIVKPLSITHHGQFERIITL